jgi:hypothetical protein
MTITAQEEIEILKARIKELEDTLNTPEFLDFGKAVVLEASHQVGRWGSDHDAGKTEIDWIWLLGHLANKAFFNPPEADDPGASERYGTVEKKLHRIITIAAACANWHAQILNMSNMRPGAVKMLGINLSPIFTPIDFSDEELCMFSIEDFDLACRGGSFNDMDGDGRWATATQKSNQTVSPSTRNNAPEWATHVVWFNK